MRNLLLSAMLIAVPVAAAALAKTTRPPTAGLAGLSLPEAPLADPVSSQIGAMQMIAGIAVTDRTGHPLPCETMLSTLSDRLAGTTPADPVTRLQAQARSSCTAAQIARADAFSAKALALLPD